jgi:tetratricopeptide (TPR) repeat protein
MQRNQLLVLIRWAFAFTAVIALGACESESKRDPEAAVLELRNGTDELQNGAFPQAMATLTRAEALDPDNAEIQNNLGLAYFVRQRYSDAEKHIRKSLKLNPAYTDARNNLARVLIEVGEYKAALRELKRVELDLTYVFPERALVNAGMAYFYLKSYDQAVFYLTKALNAQRENCGAHSFLGRSFYEQKSYDKAAAELDKAIAYCQRSLFDEPNYYSALSYYALGNSDKAKSRLEEMIKLFPNGLYNEKARAMLELMRK